MTGGVEPLQYTVIAYHCPQCYEKVEAMTRVGPDHDGGESPSKKSDHLIEQGLGLGAT